MISLENKLAEEYLAGCHEGLSTIESNLAALANGGAEVDEQRLNLAFRAVHFIQGEASLFDLAKIGELADKMENALASIRFRKTALIEDRLGALLHDVSTLRMLIENPGAGNSATMADTMNALSRFAADGETARGTDSASGAQPAASESRSLRFLLVEDDFTSRLLLQTFLGRYGECHIAVNGREALAAFTAASEAGRAYDLICMDIMMPEMDGREALQQIRAMEEARGILSNYGAKIVMTTTVDEVKEVVGCFRELCDAYLLKPIDLSKLLNLMKSYELIP